MSIREIPANETLGRLAGFEHLCERCEMALRSSLRSALEIDIQRHYAWHERGGNGRSAERRIEGRVS